MVCHSIALKNRDDRLEYQATNFEHSQCFVNMLLDGSVGTVVLLCSNITTEQSLAWRNISLSKLSSSTRLRSSTSTGSKEPPQKGLNRQLTVSPDCLWKKVASHVSYRHLSCSPQAGSLRGGIHRDVSDIVTVCGDVFPFREVASKSDGKHGALFDMDTPIIQTAGEHWTEVAGLNR